MDYKKTPRIFVIGFMGSDRKGLAEKIAIELGYQMINLDEEIEKKDGRTILKICMMMGEHEYRNKEYEMLLKYSNVYNIVVCCGDGVILDDMNREILEKNTVIVADSEINAEELWQHAKNQGNNPYAFMHQGNEILKKERFIALYEQRKPLYNQFITRR